MAGAAPPPPLPRTVTCRLGTPVHVGIRKSGRGVAVPAGGEEGEAVVGVEDDMVICVLAITFFTYRGVNTSTDGQLFFFFCTQKNNRHFFSLKIRSSLSSVYTC